MIIELMIQHYLTSPNTKNIIKSRKIAYLGAKFFLAPCFFMLTYVISWEQRELRTAATFSKGSGYSKNDLKENGTPIILYGRLYTKYETVISEVDTFVDVQPNSVYSTGHEVIVPASGETAEDISRASFVAKSGILLGGDLNIIVPDDYINPVFLALTISNGNQQKELSKRAQGKSVVHIHNSDLENVVLLYPKYEEQEKIGEYFSKLDSLITLHQREPPKEDKILNDIKTDTLFHEYYCQWLVIYKEGSVRGVTMQKYHLTAEWVKKLIPDVKLCDFDRITYQQLINDYAETHERQTTMDFHHQLKGAILDAVDDGLIARDPTRKVIIKGKSPNDKKKKYLSRYELQKLLTSLDLNSGLNMDWLILLIAKTGMRFSEAIAVTPMDFDFTHQTLSVNKTWDYKGEGGFQPTKNKSSVRKIRLDWQTVGQFYAIVRELNDTAPIFVSKEKKIYNSTLNDVLERHCKAVGIPTISVHGLRHTHASLLLFDGVSIASVAQRLGHSSINTTQKTYLHIIRELENKDIDLIMKSISSLLD